MTEKNIWKDIAERVMKVVESNHRLFGLLNSYTAELEVEIADLKDSNERLADALAAAKERAGGS